MSQLTSVTNDVLKWTQAYYDGNPLVSDDTFMDRLNELRQMDPGNPLLTKVGFGYKHPAHLVDTLHRQFISSIDDRVKFEDVKDDQKYDWCSFRIVAMTKVDGAGLAVSYHNGSLYQGVSRGDGYLGVNITNNLVASGSIPLKIKTDREWVDIRLEGAISWEDFSSMEAAHPRNKASGLTQTNEVTPEVQKLLCIAYHIFDWDGTKVQMMEQLNEWGFIVCPYEVFDNWKAFVQAVVEGRYNTEQSHKLVNGLTLPCDGAVLVEDEDPDNCLAVKYFDESAVTECESINWAATRTGKIVPVASYTPVFLTGAWLNNATCNNADWLTEMGVHPGAKLEIVRSNMIIPTIIRVMDSDKSKIVIPTNCPTCNSVLVRKDNDAGVFCVNDDCDCKKWEVISRLFYLGNVKGLGDAGADAFYAAYNVDSVETFAAALKEVTAEKMLETIGESTTEKLMLNFENIGKFEPSVYDYVYIAAIPRVGESSCEAMWQNVDALEFISVLKEGQDPKPEWLAHISTDPGRESFLKYWDRIRMIAKFFNYQIVEYVAPPVVEYKYKYGMTGSFSVTKAVLAEEFAKHGAQWVDVGDADYVLTNNPAKKTNNLKQAEAAGKKILTESEFRDLISEV